MRNWTLVLGLAAALALAACTQQDPAIVPEDQVDAEQRAVLEAEAGGGAEDDGAEDGGSGDDAGEATGDAITVIAGDLFFDPEELTAPAGTVTFELVNEGNLPHNIVIEEAGNTNVVENDGGETSTGSIDLEAGAYTFFCDIPGHRSNMEGELVVE